MQHGIDVVEDVPLADSRVAVARLELLQRPIRDVLPPLAPVFGVGVEGKALEAVCAGAEMKIGRETRCQNTKGRPPSIVTCNDDSVLLCCVFGREYHRVLTRSVNQRVVIVKKARGKRTIECGADAGRVEPGLRTRAKRILKRRAPRHLVRLQKAVEVSGSSL